MNKYKNNINKYSHLERWIFIKSVVLSSLIDTTVAKSMYDLSNCRLISFKIIIAHILSACMQEFINRDIPYIMKCIENIPLISQIGVHDGEVIEGRHNEIPISHGGRKTMDIVTNVYVPVYKKRKYEKKILNIEIQNACRYGYAMQARKEVYGGTLLAMQYGKEYTKKYGKVKQVYSIWIMTNPPKGRRNTITKEHMVKTYIKGKVKNDKAYQVVTIITMNLGEPKECTGVLRLLAVLLSNKLRAEEKKRILEEEFQIRLNEKEEKEVEDMCDLADAIEREGRKEGEREALLYSLNDMIEIKYSRHISWLEELTVEKLKQLMRLIVTDMSFDDFCSYARKKV